MGKIVLLNLLLAFNQRRCSYLRLNKMALNAFETNSYFDEVDYTTSRNKRHIYFNPAIEQNDSKTKPIKNLKLFIHSFFSVFTRIPEIFMDTFLPSGYPNSVPPEYVTFQTWNLIQDLCSYLRGIMSTHAVLEGLGVGRADMTSVQATILWVLRDGASMVGGLLFTTFSSANFGQNAKSWRLFADYINNVGTTLDLIAPLSKMYFLPLICLSSIFKALCGVSAGASGAVFSEHWGQLQGNIAEVNSKNGAQHTAVSLIGLAVSMPFTDITCRSPVVMWSVYFILTAIHMFCNYQAMRTLQLRSVNLSRGGLLIKSFLDYLKSNIPEDRDSSESLKSEKIFSRVKDSLKSQDFKKIFSLKHVAKTEPILSLLVPRCLHVSRRDPQWHLQQGFVVSFARGSVRLWTAPSELLSHLQRVRTSSSSASAGSGDDGESVMMEILKDSRKSHYGVFKERSTAYVCFAQSCEATDQIRGLLEAAIAIEWDMDGVTAKIYCDHLFPLLMESLTQAGWDMSRVLLRPREARAIATTHSE